MGKREKRILKALGVRGSFPVADQGYLEYGGNTSCFSLEYPDRIVVFDAGTGLDQILWKGKPVHIFLSHLHMDHVMGLFTWPVLFCPEAEVHFYGQGQAKQDSLSEQLQHLFDGEFWPVKLHEVKANLQFHTFLPGNQIEFPLDGGTTCRISSVESYHTRHSMVFRLDEGTHSLVYLLDYELGQADEVGLARLKAFVHHADYLIFDAQYTDEELPAHAGWGHSSWEQGVELGKLAGIGCVMMTHYDRSHDDKFLRFQEKQLREYGENALFIKEKQGYLLW